MTRARSNSLGYSAKGDLIVGSAADTAARLAVGTNGYALIADSTQSTGLAYKNLVPDQTSNSGKYLTTDGTNTSWGTISAGGLTLISETVASNNSGISLSSIPSTYKQLLLVYEGVYMGTGASDSSFVLRFNNDSGSNYSEWNFGSFDGVIASGGGNQSSVGTVGGWPAFGRDVQTTTNYQNMIQGSILIDNYADTSKYKFYKGVFSYRRGGSYDNVCYYDGTYKSTSAISSLDIVRTVGDYELYNATNTSIRLYGVA